MENKEINKIENCFYKIEKLLSENENLYDSEHLYSIREEKKDLEGKLEVSKEAKRVLQIGIIGAVKAGKSSFLNALLFDGKDVLPKAATPMTASLTKISYAPENSAKIHFYSQEDWKDITDMSREYDFALENAYEEYKKGNLQTRKNGGIVICSKEDYEKKIFRREVNENLLSAKEITKSIENNEEVLSKIGGTETVDGELDIKSYVSAGGKYATIVNYIELFRNDEILEDFVIVDTPGLYDPIRSRGLATKKFLAKCDVAILLSPTTQFMDNNTVQAMLHSFPSKGIREILVVGSKFDSVLLDYPKDNINVSTVATETKKTCKQSLKNNFGGKGVNSNFEKILANDPIFISALFYSILNKKKKGEDLNEEEEVIIKGFKNKFAGFSDEDEKLIGAIANINGIKKALNGVLERKEKIIDERDGTIISLAKSNMLRTIKYIYENAKSRKGDLENNSLDEIETKQKKLGDLVESTDTNIKSVFNKVVNEVEKEKRNIDIKLEKELNNYKKIHLTSKESKIEKTRGLFWWKKIYYETIIEYRASVGEVIKNIKGYVVNCKEIINEDFDFIINKEGLTNQIKKIFINAMESGDFEYDENDILMPLDEMISKIKIPNYPKISFFDKLDRVRANFGAGYVKDDDMYELEMEQEKVLEEIFEIFSSNLEKCLDGVKCTLVNESVNFAKKIGDKITYKFDILKKQKENSEKYIKKYENLISELNSIRDELG